MDRLKREPAVVIGIIAAAVLATVQSLAGNGVIGADLAATVVRALDPATGWALPIIVGLITRYFVYSPDAVAKIVTQMPRGQARATAAAVLDGAPPAVQPQDLPGGHDA
jgi:hypothetical protein